MNIQILDPGLGPRNNRYDRGSSSDGDDDLCQIAPAKVDHDDFQLLADTS